MVHSDQNMGFLKLDVYILLQQGTCELNVRKLKGQCHEVAHVQLIDQNLNKSGRSG